MASVIPQPVTDLINLLQRLPGIGPRSAERLTYFLLKAPEEEVEKVSQTLQLMKSSVTRCQECFNIAEAEMCEICVDGDRHQDLMIVVEDPLDLFAIEKTGRFKGLFHVLDGLIDPIRGIGVEELRVYELIERIQRLLDRVDAQLEIVIATNPSTEGETTAAYLKKMICERYAPEQVKLTRIARGIPVGGDLEYADPITLQRSLDGRSEY